VPIPVFFCEKDHAHSNGIPIGYFKALAIAL
jgi:hypothetical protein